MHGGMMVRVDGELKPLLYFKPPERFTFSAPVSGH